MRFTGQYLDSFGTYNLRAREYDPATARFLSTDPASTKLVTPYNSSYVYADGKPTTMVDPTGMSSWTQSAWESIGTGLVGLWSPAASAVTSVGLALRDCRPGSPSFDAYGCAFSAGGALVGAVAIVAGSTFGAIAGSVVFAFTPEGAGESTDYAAQQRAKHSSHARM